MEFSYLELYLLFGLSFYLGGYTINNETRHLVGEEHQINTLWIFVRVGVVITIIAPFLFINALFNRD